MFKDLRLRYYASHGWNAYKIILHDHYWEDANGNPDWQTTSIHLNKGFKFRKIKFRGNVQDLLYDLWIEYKEGESNE